MADILRDILDYKRDEVAAAKREKPLASLDNEARATQHPRGFIRALKEKVDAGETGLIAEIKRASPSRGLIRKDFEPAALAQTYARGGAACLSVLTDTPSFQGAPAHLKAARAACGLPILRKDFMVDPYQVAEARAWGADCILVIMAAVDDALARDLIEAARAYELDVLAETHDRAELDRALDLECQLIGVNNRNLRTFETRLETTFELAAHAPPEALVVSESGISTAEDISRLRAHGVKCVLIGETFMRQSDVEGAVRALLGG